jgi:Pyruvate/2-oxoacid:ferredoxin oxidoreductase gamma subunit
MITVGALLKATGLYTTDEIKLGIEKSVPASKAWLIEKNIEAVNIGYNYEG